MEEKIEHIYLEQLDKTEKFYKWKVTSFVMAIVPLGISSLLQSTVLIIISIVFGGLVLLLTFEPSPEVHMLNWFKFRGEFLMKQRVETNNQSYSMNRLEELTKLLGFDEIKHNHITKKKAKGIFLELPQCNDELMTIQQIDQLMNYYATLLSNLDYYKILTVEISQNYDNQINHNEDLEASNDILAEMIKKRKDYLVRLQNEEEQDEKVTVLYLETLDDSLPLFMSNIVSLAHNNNINLKVVEGDKLVQILSSIISNRKSSEVLPLSTEEYLKENGVL